MLAPRPTEYTQSPTDILRENGRSFHFARIFLTQAQGERAARLYAFCRYVDDLADETRNHAKALRELDDARRQLAHRTATHPRLDDFIQLAEETDIDLSIAISLIDGVASDLSEVAFQSEEQLLRYAYQVAGTVGLMMCGVLGVKKKVAYPFAIDLGIAMQLTNIARDIQEDAINGRRYIPAPWVNGAPATAIMEATPTIKPLLVSAADRLITLAERYYQSAYNGFGFLPARARFAILVAAKLYRQIGVKLQRNGYVVWHGRTIVNTGEKVAVAAGASWFYVTKRNLHLPANPHQSALHISLYGLTGTNVGQQP